MHPGTLEIQTDCGGRRGVTFDPRSTAEVSRSQVWQWIRSPKGKLDDGRVTKDLVRELIPQEMEKITGLVDPAAYNATYVQAAKIFEDMSTSETFTEFLTLPLYEKLD